MIPNEEFAGGVAAFAQHLAGLSREALGLAKLAIDAAAGDDRTSSRHIDRIANTLLVLSEEHRRTPNSSRERP